MPHVRSLHIYPIKSCRGLELKSVRFDAMGPLYDRRTMLIDDSGKFLSQRTLPEMALIVPSLLPTGLSVSAPGMPPLKVNFGRALPRVEVSLWGGRGEAEDLGEHAAEWFSSFLGRHCRLVRFPDDGIRPVDRRYARFDARVAFADGFPVLLTNQSSLEALNLHSEEPLPMSRFRPNLVIEGAEAFAEDGWRSIRAGDLTLDVVKPCARCAITTVDQVTAKVGKEPLLALARFRKHDNRVLFGQNCVHHGPGSVRVGDPIEVLERTETQAEP